MYVLDPTLPPSPPNIFFVKNIKSSTIELYLPEQQFWIYVQEALGGHYPHLQIYYLSIYILYTYMPEKVKK